MDAHVEYRETRWKLSANYSYLEATFRNSLVLSSNSPAADDDGLIYVRPGDDIPLNPAHRAHAFRRFRDDKSLERRR
ncbi:MAG: hypothetical protein WDM89_10865 [Rhizomicrobium sp.]